MFGAFVVVVVMVLLMLLLMLFLLTVLMGCGGFCVDVVAFGFFGMFLCVFVAFVFVIVIGGDVCVWLLKLCTMFFDYAVFDEVAFSIVVDVADVCSCCYCCR